MIGSPFLRVGSFRLSNAWAAKWHRRRRTTVAAGHLSLKRLSTMLDAIGETWVHRRSTEVEIGLAGMTKRPFANLVVQVEQRRLARHFRTWPSWDEATWRCRGCRRSLIARPLTQETTRSDRAKLSAGWTRRNVRRKGRRRRWCLPQHFGLSGNGFRRRFYRGRNGRGCRIDSRSRRSRRSGGSLLRFVRLHRRWPRFQIETMCLADNGIAADSAQVFGDLAGGQAFFPHRFQPVDAFVGPGHIISLNPRLRALRADARVPNRL